MEFELKPIGKLNIFKDENSNSYFNKVINTTSQVVQIPSEELFHTIASILNEKKQKPTKTLVNGLIEELKMHAMNVKDIEKISFRYVIYKGNLYIYKGENDLLIKISKKGVKYVRNPEIKIVHSKHRGAIACQKEITANFGLFLELFWKYVPIRNKQDQLLLLAYMIIACIPDSNYPILLITGRSGSAKSSTTRVIKSVIDPSSFELSAPLTSITDIKLAAAHNHLLAFDNNGDIFSSELQNLLCQLSTGAKIFDRKFYTNGEVIINKINRPVIFNGLQSPFSQDDVISRVLHIRLRPLTSVDYARTGGESNWKNQFEADLPIITSGFHDLLQRVFPTRDQIEMPNELPRLGDFAKIGIALEQVLKLEKGSFLKAYESNLNYGSSLILEDSDLGQAVISLANNLDDAAIYTRNELIQELKKYSHFSNAIPANSRTFKTELDRIEKALFQTMGIRIRHINRTRDGAKVEVIPPTKKLK